MWYDTEILTAFFSAFVLLVFLVAAGFVTVFRFTGAFSDLAAAAVFFAGAAAALGFAAAFFAGAFFSAAFLDFGFGSSGAFYSTCQTMKE